MLCASPPTVWLVVTSPQLKSGELKDTMALFKSRKTIKFAKKLEKHTDFAGSVSRGSPWPSWPDSMTNTVTSGFCVSLFAIVKPNDRMD